MLTGKQCLKTALALLALALWLACWWWLVEDETEQDVVGRNYEQSTGY